MTEFSEIQKNDRKRLAIVGLAAFLAMLGPLILSYNNLTDQPDITNRKEMLSNYLLLMLGMVVFVSGILAFIFSQRLEIHVNKFRLRFRMPPFVKWKEISAEEIESFRVEKAKWFQKLRKGRIHYNPFTNKWSYLLTRKYFVELKLRSGKTILLSTGQPTEIKAALDGLLKKEK